MQFHCLKNPHNESRDVVIVTVPWTDSSIPLMAPAQLKPIVESAGMSCLATDVNAEVFTWTQNHEKTDSLLNFFFDGQLNDDVKDELFELFKNISEQIVAWQPKIVGLSLFSYVSQHSTRWLAWFLKKTDPSLTIIIGGAGCLPTFTGPSEFAKDLIDKGLIDYHIRGDGEHALYEFLKDHRDYVGINSLEWRELPMDEMRNLPMPDYSNYKFNLYAKKVLPLVGSRGCVRKCTFCDYIANWKQFNWRTADDIFAEMQKQYKTYGIRYFKFQDSLTNGNMKEFVRLTEMLSDYNKQNPDQSFRWSGYYIFREHNANTAKEWKLVSESGAENLSVGIENLNQHIRYAIGKKFSNEAIDVHLSYAKKYGIQLQLLNIVGYVNETQEDIDFISDWLYNHTHYKDILYLQWGGTLGIFPNTWLEKNFDDLGVEKVDNTPQGWVNKSIDSTPAKRAQWAKDLSDTSEKLGYKVANNLDNHYLLEMLIND
jgi:hypothetical protein